MFEDFMFTRFRTIHEHDGQTDTAQAALCSASRSKMESVKTYISERLCPCDSRLTTLYLHFKLPDILHKFTDRQTDSSARSLGSSAE